MRIALFGIHKILSDNLAELEKQNIFPEVVIFPPMDSVFHQFALQICQRNNIRYIRPESVKDPKFIDELRTLVIDRIIVTGYHQIFPNALLDMAERGAINFHAGLLPEERGPVPWKWAVYENKPFTGLTVHQMTDKVDQGDIFYKERIALSKGETAESLFNKLGGMISRVLPGFFSEGEPGIYEQTGGDALNAGYRGQVPPDLCQFDLTQTADELQRRVRAFSPRPGVLLDLNNQKILVKKMEMLQEDVPEDDFTFRSADQLVKITDYEIIKQ